MIVHLIFFSRNGKLNIPSLYWNRYLRLTPQLGVSILLFLSLLRFFGSGPLWTFTIASSISNCRKYWWSKLLYLQNYVNPDDKVHIKCHHQWWFIVKNSLVIQLSSLPHHQCNNFTLYLSVDMQLFLIAPVLVYSVHRFKKIALIALLVSMLGCICYSPIVYLNHNIFAVYVLILQSMTIRMLN